MLLSMQSLLSSFEVVLLKCAMCDNEQVTALEKLAAGANWRLQNVPKAMREQFCSEWDISQVTAAHLGLNVDFSASHHAIAAVVRL